MSRLSMQFYGKAAGNPTSLQVVDCPAAVWRYVNAARETVTEQCAGHLL